MRIVAGALEKHEHLALDGLLEIVESGGYGIGRSDHLDVVHRVGVPLALLKRRAQIVDDPACVVLESGQSAAMGHDQLLDRAIRRDRHELDRPPGPVRGEPFGDQALQHVVDPRTRHAGQPGDLGGGRRVAAHQRDVRPRLVLGQAEPHQPVNRDRVLHAGEAKEVRTALSNGRRGRKRRGGHNGSTRR